MSQVATFDKIPLLEAIFMTTIVSACMHRKQERVVMITGFSLTPSSLTQCGNSGKIKIKSAL